ncbi:tRNA-dependent cyclodipeptide synthase [Candidatus Nomurabacteria bacterium]|nr:MAG: tRNA-dependent cyclodipeptide synthase [Candidatus Nomurabacteria bacterium]
MQNIYPIIGMSPGNSYFKDEEIKYLLKTAIDRYGKVAVMIADIPAISTYIALGYPENRARRDKALPQGNLLKNRTERAVVQLGYTKDQVRIIDWENEIEPNENYKKSYEYIRQLYESNKQFEYDANETTKGVITGSKKEIADVAVAVKTAVHYLLSEFAFLDFAPGFLGAEKVVYIYHKNWPVYENYIAGKYDGKSKDSVDFLLMENPWETYRSVWGDEDNENGSYTSALDRVEKTKTLRVAFTNYPPALFYNHETDTFSGIFYEIITAIAKKHEWQIKWSEETGYGVVIDGLDHNRFDLFGSTVWPTPERKEKASFSKSIYTSNAYPWTLPGIEYEKLKNSPELRVVVKENDISHSIAKADFPNARLVFVPQLSDPQELLQFVTDGKGDMTFAEINLMEIFTKTKQKKLVQATSDPIRIYENTFVFKKDDLSLKNLIDDEIGVMLASGKLSELIEKYI